MFSMHWRKLIGCLLVLGLAVPLDARADEKAARADEQFLAKVAKLPTDDASLLKLLREQCRLGEALAKVDQLVRQLGAPVFTRREAAMRDLKALGWAALPALKANFGNADQEIARRAKACAAAIEQREEIDWVPAAVKLLVSRRSPGAFEMLLDYLPFTKDPEVEEEIYWGLDEMIAADGRLVARLAVRLKDPLPARRAVAACILARRGDAKQRDQVRAVMGNDGDSYVLLRSAQGMVAIREASALPILIDLLSLDSIAITWQAEELLRWAAGETAPKEVLGKGTKEQREPCQKAWRNWWRQHQQGFRFEAADLWPCGPGLIFASGAKGAGDPKGDGPRDNCIWLTGCDGVARYQLFSDRRVKLLSVLPEARLLLVRTPTFNWRDAVIEIQTVAGEVQQQFALEEVMPERCHRLPSSRLQFSGSYLGIYDREVVCEETGEVVRIRGNVYRQNRAVRKPALLHLRTGGVVGVDSEPSGSCKLYEKNAAGKLVWEEFTQYPHTQPQIVCPLVRFGFSPGSGVIKAVDSPDYCLRALKSQDSMMRRRALVKMQNGPLDDRVFDAALKALEDPETFVARGAFLVLARFPARCEEVLPRLMAFVGDERLGGPLCLKEVFDAMGPNKVIPALVKAVRDRDGEGSSERRVGAILALTVWYLDATPEVTSLVKQALRDEDAAVRKWVALNAVSHPKGKILLPQLVQTLDDPEQEIAVCAIGSLSRLLSDAEPAIPALLKAMEKRHLRSGAVNIFKAVGLDNPEVLTALVKSLDESEDPAVIALSAEAIGARGKKAKTTVKALVKVLGHKWEGEAGRQVQSKVIQALGNIGPDAKEALPALEKLLSTPGHPQGWEELIATVIVRIDPKAAKRVERYIPRRLSLEPLLLPRPKD